MKTRTGWGRGDATGQNRFEPTPPGLLVIGHVCRDVIGRAHRLGGAAAFASRAAACLGVPTGVVTVAPRRFAAMAPLLKNPLISIHCRPCTHETAFALEYNGPERCLHLLQRAPDLVAADIPEAWRRAPVAYVAPVIGECHRDAVLSLPMPHVVVGAQGWLRAVDGDGMLVPAVSEEFLQPPQNVHAAVFSELDHPEAEALAAYLAARHVIVALTRGHRGATLFTAHQHFDVPASPAHEVEPTGAGDVFGVVLALALARGANLKMAAEQAAYAAARVVEGPGMGKLASAMGHVGAVSA